MQILLTVVGSVMAALILMAFVGGLGFSGWKLYRSLKAIQDGLRALNDNLNGLPVLLTGISKVCEDLVGSTVKIGGSVEQFQKTLFDPSTSGARRDRDAFTPYDEASANRAWEITQLMQLEGISEQQAKERIFSGTEGRFTLASDD